MVRTPAHPSVKWPKVLVDKPKSHRDPYDEMWGQGSATWLSRIFRHPHLGKTQISRLRAALSVFASRNVGGGNYQTGKQWMWRARAARAIREYDTKIRAKEKAATKAKATRALHQDLRADLVGRSTLSKRNGGDRRSTKFLRKLAATPRDVPSTTSFGLSTRAVFGP